MLVVFGSINQDMCFALDHLPVPGETILCSGYKMSGGGKGANQALAAARFGAKTALVGRVGDDGPGMRLLAEIRREGVMTSGVVHSEQPTGCAIVLTDSKGENQITVAQGANAEASAEQVPDDILGEGNVVLMQMETSAEHNWDIINRAKENGAKTILNLAPAIHVPLEALQQLDYLIVNELEARQIAGKLGIKAEENAALLARALAKQGNNTCIVTIGGNGSVAATPDDNIITVPCLPVDIVDTTGAGDAYCGTLAAALHEKMELPEAMKRASVAGSLSCTKRGAQPSFPHISEIEENLENLGEISIEKAP